MSREFRPTMQGKILALELLVRQLSVEREADGNAADPLETAERKSSGELFSMSTDFEIQGRITALELLVRQLLAARMADTADPLEAAERLKSGFLTNLQHLDRPVDDYSDKVWDAASAAIRLHLDTLIHRFSSRQRRGE